jgi:hypothetical protein
MTHRATNESRAEIKALASFGVGQRDIAAYVGIDTKTLSKHYRDELDKGMASTNAAVAKFLASAATGRAMTDKGATFRDCLVAAIFWGKTQMGMRETNAIEHTSPYGSMSPSKILIEAASVNRDDQATS